MWQTTGWTWPRAQGTLRPDQGTAGQDAEDQQEAAPELGDSSGYGAGLAGRRSMATGRGWAPKGGLGLAWREQEQFDWVDERADGGLDPRCLLGDQRGCPSSSGGASGTMVSERCKGSSSSSPSSEMTRRMPGPSYHPRDSANSSNEADFVLSMGSSAPIELVGDSSCRSCLRGLLKTKDVRVRKGQALVRLFLCWGLSSFTSSLSRIR